MTNRETVFTKDTQSKQIKVTRTFDAPLDRVWEAWTNSDILDQWWAPKPWRAETKSMDFTEGGFWLYAMKGPKGEVHWSKESYKTIDLHKSITNTANFCDEDGNENPDFPTMHWKKEFSEADKVTTVTIEIYFDTEAGIETIVKMGFEEGFKAGLNNLDDYLNGK